MAIRASPHAHGPDTASSLAADIASLPPLDELEKVTRANLKSMRQVRRGLRKARKSLEQVPIQQEVARRAGEAAGTTLVERLKRDATRRELRTGGLSSQVAWPGWRAHVALEEPGGAAGDVVLTPAIATAQNNLRRLGDTTDLRPQRTGGGPLTAAELQARVAAARAAIGGGMLQLPAPDGEAHTEPDTEGGAARAVAAPIAASASASASALRWATGDAAEALFDETWLRCKVIGDGEEIGDVLVLICEGPMAGDTVVVEQNSRLRPVDSGDLSGVRLSDARQAYEELREGVAESYSSLSDSDRIILDRAVSELRETVETLAYHEEHGREQVPLELARFMRMRVGLIRRRGRRQSRREMDEDRRYPLCGRCGKRARGCEDVTNGMWYCRPCWAEWESAQAQQRPLSVSDARDGTVARGYSGPVGLGLGRVVPGSWIRGSCSSASVAAGATIVEQRRMIVDLQSEVATLERHRRDLEEGYLESAELFDQVEAAQSATQRLEAIDATIREEQAWRDQREVDAQPDVHPKPTRPRARYSRRAVFGRNSIKAKAGDSLSLTETDESTTKGVSMGTAGLGLPPSSLRTAMIGSAGRNRW